MRVPRTNDVSNMDEKKNYIERTRQAHFLRYAYYIITFENDDYITPQALTHHFLPPVFAIRSKQSGISFI